MEWLAEILIEAFPWLEGYVDTAVVVVTAIPGGFGLAIPTFLILVVGSAYLLKHFGYARTLMGGDRDDDQW